MRAGANERVYAFCKYWNLIKALCRICIGKEMVVLHVHGTYPVCLNGVDCAIRYNSC